MNYIQSKPYFLFLGVILVLLSFGFYKGSETLDINIHDTYFIISWNFLMILISIIYGILALTYFSILKLNFSLINWMTIGHVFISIIGLLTIFALPKFKREVPIGNVLTMINDIDFNERIGYGIGVSVIILLGAQFLFFINVIYALVKGRF